MNNKGFTLVELLAAIIILSLLALLASTSVTNVVKNSKSDLYNSQMTLIKSAAELWGADNLSMLPNAGECKYLTLGDLKKYGTLDSNIINPKTNEEFSDDMLIKISSKDTGYGSLNIGYEVDADDIKGCSKISISFAVDDWETIISNVKSGSLENYKVGDTKEIILESSDGKIDGIYTVRIANMSTPQECNSDNFSQTACGFVIEFADIISLEQMNSSSNSNGGWKDSSLRKYVTEYILSSFPKQLENKLLKTKVISGCNKNETDNFVTDDDIFLLSPTEVWGKDGISNDTVKDKTRQLDYYKNIGVTTSNYAGAAKKGGNSWWLRSSDKSQESTFHFVRYDGVWNNSGTAYAANAKTGVSPAFRIG